MDPFNTALVGFHLMRVPTRGWPGAPCVAGLGLMLALPAQTRAPRRPAPLFPGSSCNALREVNAGANAAVVAAPIELPPGACDPLFQR